MRETPDRILDAAERCMDRYGLGVSMRDVAVEAGLSRGSLYRYFGDRETLVAAVLERAADRFVRRAASRAASRFGGEASIADEITEAIDFVVASTRRPTVAQLPAERETPLAAVLVGHPGWVADRWMAFWRRRLAAARRRGEVRADLDVDLAAEGVTRLIVSFALVPGVGAGLGAGAGAAVGAGAEVDERTVLARFVDEMRRGLAG